MYQFLWQQNALMDLSQNFTTIVDLRQMQTTLVPLLHQYITQKQLQC